MLARGLTIFSCTARRVGDPRGAGLEIGSQSVIGADRHRRASPLGTPWRPVGVAVHGAPKGVFSARLLCVLEITGLVADPIRRAGC